MTFELRAPEPPRKKDRRPLDAYYTPPALTQALLDEFPEIRGGTLLDPCSGDGRMSRQLAHRFDSVIVNDIATGGRDATQPWPWKADWAVTNIPFCHSATIPFRAIEAGIPAALLMRISFLEPTDDRQWLTRQPPTAMLALWRVSFDGSGQTDSATCAWFVRGPVRPRVAVARANNTGQMGLLP